MTSTARSTPSPTSSAPAERSAATSRETFASRLGGLLTIVGVSVGLGHVWRFPYMVGRFGGAAFVLFYVVVSIVIGVPALMAEFALGRSTRRGPVGAFASAGLPPDTGFVLKSFVLQLVCTGVVIVTCAVVVAKGLRSGIERASKLILPALLAVILILMIRSLTLPGAFEGVRWYVLKFRLADLTPTVMVAAIGHAIFSLSLGGTFMVVYGSYMKHDESVARPAIWTVIGDTGSALLA